MLVMSESPPPPVRYSIAYQQMHPGSGIAGKDEDVEEILVGGSELLVLPNVGDYVDYANLTDIDLPGGVRRRAIRGRVRSRFFVYTRTTGGQVYCHINLVVDCMDIETRMLTNGRTTPA